MAGDWPRIHIDGEERDMTKAEAKEYRAGAAQREQEVIKQNIIKLEAEVNGSMLAEAALGIDGGKLAEHYEKIKSEKARLI